MSALNMILLVLAIAFFLMAAILAIIGTFKYKAGYPTHEWRDAFIEAGIILGLLVTAGIVFWVFQ